MFVGNLLADRRTVQNVRFHFANFDFSLFKCFYVEMPTIPQVLFFANQSCTLEVKTTKTHFISTFWNTFLLDCEQFTDCRNSVFWEIFSFCRLLCSERWKTGCLLIFPVTEMSQNHERFLLKATFWYSELS